MCEQVNINVQETNETINIVSSEIQEVIDINVFETTEDVTLNITEQLIQVNVNKVTSAAVTNTSELINDGSDGINPFITLADVPAQVNADYTATSGVAEILNKPILATVATSGDYTDLLNTPTIPTLTSDLTNDGEDGVNPFITANDIPLVTGFVPYTGADQDVDLGTHDLTATQGTFATSGNPDTLTVNHSSGSGKALTITKGGNGEGIYVNKTSGSGNAVTIIGDLEATNLKRTGGTSAQFLKANGSVDSNTYFQLPALTSGSVLFSNGTTIAQDNANLFWDDTNNRLGIGTNTPTNRFTLGATPAISLQQSPATLYSTNENTSNNLALVCADSGSVLSRAIFQGIRSRGTLLSPTAVFGGDAICTFISGAYDGAAIQASAALSFDAESAASIGSAPQLINFITGSTGANRTTKMQVRSNGNVLINTTTDAGFKLDVNGTARVSGTTTISPAALTGAAATSALDITQAWNTTGAPTALKLNVTDTASNASSRLLDVQVGGASRFSVAKTGVVNIDTTISTTAFSITNGGTTYLSFTPNTTIFAVGNSAGIGGIFAGSGLSLGSSNVTTAGNIISISNARGATSGIVNIISMTPTLSPTSGTAVFNGFNYSPTINQTGGANGITRGLFINPTLTAAADFRAIENSVGKVCLNTTSGNTMIGTTTDAGFRLDVNGTARVQGAMDITTGTSYTFIRRNSTNHLSIGIAVDGAADFRINNITKFYFGASATTSLEIPHTLRIAFVNPGIATFSNILWENASTEFRLVNGANTSTVNLKAGRLICSSILTSINASAILQADSTTQGFLPPRMTNAQKNAITTPATGLMVYDNVLNRPCFYDGTTWITL